MSRLLCFPHFRNREAVSFEAFAIISFLQHFKNFRRKVKYQQDFHITLNQMQVGCKKVSAYFFVQLAFILIKLR